LVWVLMGAVIVATFALCIGQENWALAVYVAWPIGIMLALSAGARWLTHRITHTAIGIQGDTITLRDHAGRESTCAATQITFDGTSIATPDMAVFLGQPMKPLYERQAIMIHLYPRLANARSVSFWQMQATLIRLRHPQGIATAAVILALIAAALGLMANYTL